ncbi:uncharacterized protein LOC113876466 isoform X3 [Bos indicus x Bos taurus]|uniref:uncharacterized protein LOC113876466 isoform X3 n=1 Tax=Bos indicus x Bos taurus TaxID=30522 RepID=UPI00095130E6|nr:PREDICTED: uncharacterized protein LOC109573023 isoform X3 [Bos indicus]XP_027371523.1 uncharacterized protein LOC113876466 isoform X3 [Bos indicus x Bos taurus]
MSSLLSLIVDKVVEVREWVQAKFLTQKQEEAREGSLVSLIMDKVMKVPEQVGAEFLAQKALLRRQRVGRFLQRPGGLGPLSRRLSSSYQPMSA